MNIPSFKDIVTAQQLVDQHLNATPLHQYARLSKSLGFELHIKHENHQPVGAFKIRGGINLISQLSSQEKVSGVIAASTGNHGQSVAYASQLFLSLIHI